MSYDQGLIDEYFNNLYNSEEYLTYINHMEEQVKQRFEEELMINTMYGTTTANSTIITDDSWRGIVTTSETTSRPDMDTFVRYPTNTMIIAIDDVLYRLSPIEGPTYVKIIPPRDPEDIEQWESFNMVSRQVSGRGIAINGEHFRLVRIGDNDR